MTDKDIKLMWLTLFLVLVLFVGFILSISKGDENDFFDGQPLSREMYERELLENRKRTCDVKISLNSHNNQEVNTFVIENAGRYKCRRASKGAVFCTCIHEHIFVETIEKERTNDQNK